MLFCCLHPKERVEGRIVWHVDAGGKAPSDAGNNPAKGLITLRRGSVS
jgi:hypothetical protein